MRKIGVVTVGRSDYGIYFPILKRIDSDPDIRLHLIVAGMHLLPEFGSTVKEIEADGFEIAERIEMLLSSDSPTGIAQSMGMGTIGFAKAYTRFRPDILVVLGDRFEMHAAALAALPFKIPVAHIHGGELTQGAFDDCLRHSITKLSHLHFVATEEYFQRVLQLGEEPWRVYVSGAPSLDNLSRVKRLNADQLEKKFSISINSPPLMVTFHPVTLEYERTAWHVGELLDVLKSFKMPMIFTMPNADTENRTVSSMIEDFSLQHSSTQDYFSLMSVAAAMIGNSSSGIIEAPSFELPVVNIGSRQAGRIRAANVIDVSYERKEVAEGLTKALSPEFRANLKGLKNPYGSGKASEVIVEKLKEIDLNERLITKRFYDAKITSFS
jgi:UDP-hydrolysing UDP-N-acetyl-D-glucosamine 2-epimerase